MLSGFSLSLNEINQIVSQHIFDTNNIIWVDKEGDKLMWYCGDVYDRVVYFRGATIQELFEKIVRVKLGL